MIALPRFAGRGATSGGAALLGLALAVAAPFAAPSSPIIPGPDSLPAYAAAAFALACAFAIGFAWPRGSLYGLVAVAVLEGALRKWVHNDVTVFLVKDFLVLGIYGAVLPTLTRRELRRPWWALVPLALLLGLALAHIAGSGSPSEAVIGLRSYAIYVPLLWVAPRLLDTSKRILVLLAGVLLLGVLNAVLATVQALTGGVWLNETAPGVIPALVVVDGVGTLRPTGTMLQVGTLSAFLLFSFIAAFGLIVGHRRGWPLAAGIAGVALLGWGVVYTGSRVLFATAAVGAAGLFVHLLSQRRFLTVLAVSTSTVAAYLVLAYQPVLGGAVRAGNDSHFLRNETFSYIDHKGQVKTVEVSIGRGDPKSVAGNRDRAVGLGGGETKAYERPENRVALQLRLLRDQSLIGHGTGTQTLGTQYLQEVSDSSGRESEYVRVAYELGFPGLAAWIWFLLAIWLAAAWSAFRGPSTGTGVAAAALATATLVPLLTALTFAFEYPSVAILYYALAGIALAGAGEAFTRRRAEATPDARS